jgi:hypothetical protein
MIGEMIKWKDATMQLTAEKEAEMIARVGAAYDWGLHTVELTELELDRRAPAIDASDSALRGAAADLFRMGFRLDEEDSDREEGRYWAHQGLTGTADAYDSEELDGRKFLVISSHINIDWSELSDDEIANFKDLCRLTIVDVTKEASHYDYTHVLLVTVKDGEPVPLESHVGGVVWRGNVLYIASGEELLEFSLYHLFDLQSPRGSTGGSQFGTASIGGPGLVALAGGQPRSHSRTWGNIVKKDRGGYWAFGYRYALVLQRKYTWSKPANFSHYFATVGLAREGSKRWLVTAPWIESSSDLDECLLGFWPLLDSGYLEDRKETIDADCVAKAETLAIQGICVDEGIAWLCTSKGEGDHTLATMEIVADGTWIGNIWDWTYDWAKYGEGLTYAPSSDHLWNVTEYPKGSRVIFCIDRSRTRTDLAD